MTNAQFSILDANFSSQNTKKCGPNDFDTIGRDWQNFKSVSDFDLN